MDEGFSTASLVLGIIALCVSVITCLSWLLIILSLLAIIFGIIGLASLESTGKCVSGICLGVLAVIVAIVMQVFLMGVVADFLGELGVIFENPTETIMEESLDVEFGSFEVEENELFSKTGLKVLVKNTGEERASFYVSIEAIDQDGTWIGTDTIYVESLGAGQSEEFVIFKSVPLEKISRFKTATFQVYKSYMYE